MHHDDFKFEPVRGLPEALPKDEFILWQGAPDFRRLAVEALCVRWVAGYFALLTFWRIGASSADFPLTVAFAHGVPFALGGLIACGLLYGLAYMQAKATVYTLTNKRVAMRIGAALTMTLNVPYVQIGNAALDLRKGGTGTLVFETIGGARLSYLMTWPHVKPWSIARTKPALRCIPDAARVADIFAEAAETRLSQPVVSAMPTAMAAE